MIKRLLVSPAGPRKLPPVLRVLLKGMRARYILALLSVALLSTVSYVSFDNIIKTEAYSATIINISGRQRMLSQRIPLLADLIVAEPAKKRRGELVERLQESLTLMRTSHAALINGNAALGIAPLKAMTANKLFSVEMTNLDVGLQAFFQSVRIFASKAKQNQAGVNLHPAAKTLADMGNTLLPQLDVVVSQLEAESQKTVVRLQRWQTGVFIAILIVLSIEGFVIFWPLEKELNRNFRLLIKSREHARKSQEKADLANRAKSEFLANMSHELRTPLNAINGFSELMSIESFGPLGHKNYREYSKDIMKSGRQLLYMIDDILDVAQIESGTLRLSEDPVNIRRIFKEARSMFLATASQDNITLKIEDFGAPYILADYTRVRQIILNLVSNAVKFSKPGGCVTMGVDGEGKNDITLWVHDEGIGISSNNIEYVTEPFAQVQETYCRDHGGSGLGLTLCQSLMNLHDGELVIISHLDTGTVVRAQFPPERRFL